ncbi:hypothetical protein ES703_41177 [subsurface metagenome]
MPPQEFALVAPTTEEMTRVAVVGVGAGFTGAIEGVIVAMAPKLGALEPVATWGALLGVPAVGVVGALMAKGILGDLAMGIAAGGAAILGYTMPSMLEAFTARGASKGAGQGGLLGAGPGVKQLMAGPLGAPQRAQSAVRSVLEI